MKRFLAILAVIALVFTVIILAPPLNVDVHVICDSDMGFFIKKTTCELLDGNWYRFGSPTRRNVYVNLGNWGFLIVTGISIIGLVFYLCMTKLDKETPTEETSK